VNADRSMSFSALQPASSRETATAVSANDRGRARRGLLATLEKGISRKLPLASRNEDAQAVIIYKPNARQRYPGLLAQFCGKREDSRCAALRLPVGHEPPNWRQPPPPHGRDRPGSSRQPRRPNGRKADGAGRRR